MVAPGSTHSSVYFWPTCHVLGAVLGAVGEPDDNPWPMQLTSLVRLFLN